ncbi:NodT family efflux transporter outer membrane factor (OMF) lipoprotein [Acinetobacter calcoaceticus]|uniref:NodT family efflux transporter outer membrane factor (OMF) lipoprotein n=1 Tax=Acinetobacter calcoaceticus TaxID=471 RepID=A0A4R1XG56_ACICA|nr:NodT family efflux transporter outer membrane factor (OMF) lipoprotein [Acinetobacter calcoaceticus]
MLSNPKLQKPKLQKPKLQKLKLQKPILALMLLGTLAGCQNLQPRATPEVALSNHYAYNDGEQRVVLKWQDYLNDPVLEQLIEQALVKNQDLKLASLRVLEAQAAYGIQRSQLFPSIGGEVSGQRTRVPTDLSYTGQAMFNDQYQVGIGMSQWELDLWGRIRSLNESALNRFFATQWNQAAVRNSIIQQVTQTYLSLSELEKRIVFAQRAVHNYEKSAQIFQRRYEVGAGSKVEYTQAFTMLSQGQSLLMQLYKAREMTNNYMVQLLGEPVSVSIPELDQVAFKHANLQAGLPAELLLNRPDIAAKEALLQAQHANIHAARTAFFPRIALTGSVGTASADLDGLFKSGSSVWAFAPSISIPIFTAGRLKNNLNLAEVRTDMAVVEYEKTVQNAFREVADALSERYWLTQQLEIEANGLNAFNERVRLAELRYESGAVSHLEVLDAQRSLLQAEQQWIETQSAVLKSYVKLYVALGGDSQMPGLG